MQLETINRLYLELSQFATAKTGREIALELVISQLKRGDCWCEMACGNPMFKDHTAGCKLAQQALKP